MSLTDHIVARDQMPLTHLNGAAYADSRVIAKSLDNEHRNLMELLSNFQDEFEEFGLIRFETEEISGRGRPARYALLNEDQCYLLLTYSRNSDAARQVKRGLVRAFKQVRDALVPHAQQPLSALDALEQMVTALRTQDRRLELLEGGHVELEARLDDQPISAHADKRNHIYALVHELGSALGGTYHVGLTWRRFKAFYNLSKYDALPVKRYDEAVVLLTGWLEKAKQGDGLFN